jgi:hypothetical protein
MQTADCDSQRHSSIDSAAFHFVYVCAHHLLTTVLAAMVVWPFSCCLCWVLLLIVAVVIGPTLIDLLVVFTDEADDDAE